LLNGEDGGLEKNEFLNIYFNDSIGKRELLYELMLNATLPKEWGTSEEPKEIPEGQEMGVILVDIQGSFSCYKFLEKVRNFYESNNLEQGSFPVESMTQQ